MFIKIMKSKQIKKYYVIISYILSIFIALLVFFTGGTPNVYSNLMYIPISIISSTNGKRRGIIHAVISGLMLGPFMHVNSGLNIYQAETDWIIRLAIYVAISAIIGLFYDYNKKNESYITNLLTHDTNTKLKNIQAFKNEEKQQLNHNYKIIISMSVKCYNEMISVFGYNFTNKIVLKFSEMLNLLLRDRNNVDLYKHEGMDFVLVITPVENENGEYLVEEVVNNLENLNKKSIYVDDIPIYLEIVMGMSFVNDKTSLLEGLRQSLIALEYANSKDIKLAKYDAYLDLHYKNIIRIASNFIYALNNSEIKIAEQNVYSSKTGEKYGVELLARWIREDGTNISPNVFIPIVEKTELINELTKFMINYAVENILNGSFINLVVSINFSAKDFNDELVNFLIDKVKKSNIKKGQLQLEITERNLADEELVKYFLDKIRNHGISIAIDDFGTGYSSYQYSSQLPIDVLKIDKSLIDKIGECKISRDAVKSIVDFCKIHNFKTVAEGVETKEVVDACMEIGIDYLQGYYFHKPTIICQNAKSF